MRIAVIRHGKVNYKWNSLCTSDEFDRACGEYDAAPVYPSSDGLSVDGFQNIYISTLPRSRDTAAMLSAGGAFVTTPWIDEVPLRSSLDTGIRLPLWYWNISGRIQWFFNSSRQTESRLDTEKRAKAFVDRLCREGADSAVVTHGFFMHVLLTEMKKAGFRISGFRIFYKNRECILAER